jgi:hypothetical protein
MLDFPCGIWTNDACSASLVKNVPGWLCTEDELETDELKLAMLVQLGYLKKEYLGPCGILPALKRPHLRTRVAQQGLEPYPREQFSQPIRTPPALMTLGPDLARQDRKPLLSPLIATSASPASLCLHPADWKWRASVLSEAQVTQFQNCTHRLLMWALLTRLLQETSEGEKNRRLP